VTPRSLSGLAYHGSVSSALENQAEQLKSVEQWRRSEGERTLRVQVGASLGVRCGRLSHTHASSAELALPWCVSCMGVSLGHNWLFSGDEGHSVLKRNQSLKPVMMVVQNKVLFCYTHAKAATITPENSQLVQFKSTSNL